MVFRIFSMLKYFLLALAITGCLSTKETKHGFDVDATVHRSSIDTNKGIMIQVFPIDAPKALE